MVTLNESNDYEVGKHVLVSLLGTLLTFFCSLSFSLFLNLNLYLEILANFPGPVKCIPFSNFVDPYPEAVSPSLVCSNWHPLVTHCSPHHTLLRIKLLVPSYSTRVSGSGILPHSSLMSCGAQNTQVCLESCSHTFRHMSIISFLKNTFFLI